jgi:oligogalacturonide lyase
VKTFVPWSVHFNISPDGKLFAGDGDDEGQVARAKNGKWIYLFRPEEIHVKGNSPEPHGSKLIHPMVLRSKKLVNMSRHDYDLEPTPDGKWIVFRGNFDGSPQVYLVEIERTKK